VSSIRVLLIVTLALAGCGGGTAGVGPGDPQTPPTGRAAIEQWLSQALYKSWKCEPAVHGPLFSYSAHGRTRICSNDPLTAAGPGEFPVGSASVKELYDATEVMPIGYAVSRHTSAGGSGNSWYWYEQGIEGQGASVCVSCHQTAGQDRAGHDFVFVQVR